MLADELLGEYVRRVYRIKQPEKHKKPIPVAPKKTNDTNKKNQKIASSIKAPARRSELNEMEVEKRFLAKLDELRQTRMKFLENSTKMERKKSSTSSADIGVTLNMLRQELGFAKKTEGNIKPHSKHLAISELNCKFIIFAEKGKSIVENALPNFSSDPTEDTSAQKLKDSESLKSATFSKTEWCLDQNEMDGFIDAVFSTVAIRTKDTSQVRIADKELRNVDTFQISLGTLMEQKPFCENMDLLTKNASDTSMKLTKTANNEPNAITPCDSSVFTGKLIQVYSVEMDSARYVKS